MAFICIKIYFLTDLKEEKSEDSLNFRQLHI